LANVERYPKEPSLYGSTDNSSHNEESTNDDIYPQKTVKIVIEYTPRRLFLPHLAIYGVIMTERRKKLEASLKIPLF